MRKFSNNDISQFFEFNSFNLSITYTVLAHLIILLVLVIILCLMPNITSFYNRQKIISQIQFTYAMSILFMIIFSFKTNGSKLPIIFQFLFELKFATFLTVIVSTVFGILVLIFYYFEIYNLNEHKFIAIFTFFFTYLSYVFIFSIQKKFEQELIIGLIGIALTNYIWYDQLKKVAVLYFDQNNAVKKMSDESPIVLGQNEYFRSNVINIKYDFQEGELATPIIFQNLFYSSNLKNTFKKVMSIASSIDDKSCLNRLQNISAVCKNKYVFIRNKVHLLNEKNLRKISPYFFNMNRDRLFKGTNDYYVADTEGCIKLTKKFISELVCIQIDVFGLLHGDIESRLNKHFQEHPNTQVPHLAALLTAIKNLEAHRFELCRLLNIFNKQMNLKIFNLILENMQNSLVDFKNLEMLKYIYYKAINSRLI